MRTDERLASLPPNYPQDLMPVIREHLRQHPRKIVVLDDDPTGTQTVHDIPVLTEWSMELLCREFESNYPAFYVLTNSRSLPESEAIALANEIGIRLSEAAQRTRRQFTVISRSDSTLRGHFPAEVDALANNLGEAFDAYILMPFFLEGRRYTLENVHYVEQNGNLVPVGETPYAQDPAFAYRSSDLRDWVAEKAHGKLSRDDVTVVSLDDLRMGGPARVTEILLGLRQRRVCAVNAASYRDVEVFVTGVLAAEAAGGRYLYRTAASFVRVRAGLSARPLLTANEMGISDGAALIVVGSFVPTTSAQLAHTLDNTAVYALEVDTAALIAAETQEREIGRVAQLAQVALSRGDDTLIYTSRALIRAQTSEANLMIGARISNSLVQIVNRITTRPRFVLAKGGITSSDIAKSGLGIQRALVLGQVLPGVPVWRAGNEARFPGIPVVIFPGNVGSAEDLTRILSL